MLQHLSQFKPPQTRPGELYQERPAMRATSRSYNGSSAHLRFALTFVLSMCGVYTSLLRSRNEIFPVGECAVIVRFSFWTTMYIICETNHSSRLRLTRWKTVTSSLERRSTTPRRLPTISTLKTIKIYQARLPTNQSKM